MRRLTIALSCLLFFCGGWCLGQETAMNGTAWKSLSLFEKSLYVLGFTRGRVAGMKEGMNAAIGVIASAIPASSLKPEQREKLLEKANEIDEKSASNPPFTMGQIEATVSTFYDDYRNAPVCWDDAVRFSILSLRGNAPTEQELNTARKKGAETGCR